jgi:ABC-type sugar transport system substrate-binding protein
MRTISRKVAIATGGLFVAASLALAGCSAAPSAAPEEDTNTEAAAEAPTQSLKVGVIYLDNNSGFYAGVKKGVDALAAEAGVDVEVIEANSLQDAVKEAGFIESMIADKVDAILISASSGDASIPAVKAAFDAGIPVICYNTCIQEPELNEYVAAYAVGNQVEFGYSAGIAMADALLAKGIEEPSIGVVNCEFVEVCIDRKNGFEQALGEKLASFTIADSQAGGDASASLTTAQNILTANPDIDAFFGQYGDATVGALKAVEAAAADIVVVGGDMSIPLGEAMVAGSVSAMVDISGVISGRTALQTALDIIAGNPPAEIMVNVPVSSFVTPDEAQAWIDEHPDGIG